MMFSFELWLTWKNLSGKRLLRGVLFLFLFSLAWSPFLGVRCIYIYKKLEMEMERGREGGKIYLGSVGSEIFEFLFLGEVGTGVN